MKNLFCLCVLFSLSFVLELQASYITLETTIAASVSNSQVTVRAESVNSGDEKALNVRIEALFPGAPQSSSIFPKMDPKAKMDHAFGWMLPTDLKYRQMVIPVVTHYADGNMYPFSSITYTVVNRDTPPVVTIFGKMDPMVILKTGELSVTLRSLDGRSHKVEVSLVLPKELSADQITAEAEVLASSEVLLPFKVRNFSALAGSRYVVLAIVSEQTPDGLVQNAVMGNIITQNSRDYWMSYARKGSAVLAIILGVIYVILIVVRPNRRRTIAARAGTGK